MCIRDSSKEQIEYAKQNSDNMDVEFKLMDYRNLDEKFDAIYSIGMFEAVGYKNYREFFKIVRRSLKDNGAFLLHTIGGNESMTTTDPWIEKYIFPNGRLPSATQICKASEKYLRERRSKIGMVFQQFNLFPHMTALQNCTEAPIQVLGLKKEEAEERALDLLELVGLTDKKDEHPTRLSGGQQQRVAIARALAMRPKVMLLDEITSSLDPEVVGEVLNVIRSLNKEHNLTMIMVTHQMGFAREISDRVCFFYEGKIFEQGPPEQIFDNPQNERTKQFLNAVLDAK